MNGGTGDDTFLVDDAGDVVGENAGEGTDTVVSSLTDYSIAALANVENVTGNSASNVLTGNGAANVLTGLDGNDVLDGGAGADILIGGAGNDTYLVDSAGDVVTELAGEGFDIVRSSVGITLPANVEVLILVGSGNINASGDAQANSLTGNGGKNTLKGLAGNDTIEGLGGNDLLDGGAGADHMKGGLGNDTYIVDNKGDVASEAGSGGTDTVKSSITFSLADVNHAIGKIENLILTGSGKINATGNNQKNLMTGNGASNQMVGGYGNDTVKAGAGADKIQGGLGADKQSGGAGADLFKLLTASETGKSASTRDIIQDFKHSQHDRIDLSAIDANSGLAKNQAFTFIGQDPFSGHKGELHYRFEGSTKTIVEGDINGDKHADFQIELSGHLSLVKGDFVL